MAYNRGGGRGGRGRGRGGRGFTLEQPHYILFNGMEGEDSLIEFKDYNGPVNQQHDGKIRKKPSLILASYDDDVEEELCKRRFCELVDKALDNIKSNYKEAENGPIRIVVSYGDIYCHFNHEGQVMDRMTLKHFDEEGVRGHGQVSTQQGYFFKHSFYPADAPVSFDAGLPPNPSFEFCKEKDEYLVTVERKTPDRYCPPVNLILDENFKPKEMKFNSFKWGIFDVIELRGENVRTKIQSRKTRSKEEMEGNPLYGDFVDENTRVISRSGDSVSITKNYKREISYVCHKKGKIYKMNHQKFPALGGTEIYLESTTEFSRPDAEGEFTKIVPKCELSLRPIYDNLHNKSKDIKDKFEQELWDLSLWLKQKIFEVSK